MSEYTLEEALQIIKDHPEKVAIRKNCSPENYLFWSREHDRYERKCGGWTQKIRKFVPKDTEITAVWFVVDLL